MDFHSSPSRRMAPSTGSEGSFWTSVAIAIIPTTPRAATIAIPGPVKPANWGRDHEQMKMSPIDMSTSMIIITICYYVYPYIHVSAWSNYVGITGITLFRSVIFGIRLLGFVAGTSWMIQEVIHFSSLIVWPTKGKSIQFPLENLSIKRLQCSPVTIMTYIYK